MHSENGWRELLGEVIENPEERKRLIQTLNVRSITLNRWAAGHSRPHTQNIQMLLDALPQYRTRLLKSLQTEIPSFVPNLENTEHTTPLQDSIPSAFYTRFFKERVTLSGLRRSWSLRDMTLQQALQQLDPDEEGLAVTVVQCTKPVPGRKVRTARMMMGLATPPWPRQVDMSALFLAGAESLAGYVISTGRSVVVQGRAHQGVIPVHWVDSEESVAVYPLLLSDRIGGCLTCSSTQAHFFTETRQTLLQKYAELLVLSIEPSDFYAFEDVDLSFLPDYRLQLQQVSSMHQLTLNEMQQATREHSPIPWEEAELRAWQHFEERILCLNNSNSGTPLCP